MAWISPSWGRRTGPSSSQVLWPLQKARGASTTDNTKQCRKWNKAGILRMVESLNCPAESMEHLLHRPSASLKLEYRSPRKILWPKRINPRNVTMQVIVIVTMTPNDILGLVVQGMKIVHLIRKFNLIMSSWAHILPLFWIKLPLLKKNMIQE